MANQEHLDILKQGIETWNAWRRGNSSVRPDLERVNLSKEDLRYADFHNGNFFDTIFSGTDLRNADFHNAELSYANFSDADLRNADFRGAHLYTSDLRNAKLSGIRLQQAQLNATYLETNLDGVDLKGVNLRGVLDLYDMDLRGAKLSGVILSGTNFQGMDLRDIDLSWADLRGVDFSKAVLCGASFVGADLFGANFREADLIGADFSKANFSGIKGDGSPFQPGMATVSISGIFLGTRINSTKFIQANFMGTDLSGTDFRGAVLSNANFSGADLSIANLTEVNLSGSNLSYTRMIQTNLEKAILTDSRVYGVSAWGLKLKDVEQSNLVITTDDEPRITADNIEVAQFIYLLLNNTKIRDIIDTITSKVVLILGRFTPERKTLLDTLRDELRKCNYLPVLFDFEKPANRDLTETVSTLAHLARFIIVDLTNPSSAPHEVATVIPHTVVPVLPLLWQEPLIFDGKVVERREYAMFEDLRRRYHWVLPTFRYQDTADLLASIKGQIIAPAEQKVKELTGSEKRIVSSETHRMGL